MAHSPSSTAPTVRLELRQGAGPPVAYDVTGDEFVIGTVPGCDLRLAGANLPPVICVVNRHAGGARLRKLAPAVPLLLNGKPVQTAEMTTGDTLTLGPLSIAVSVTASTPRAVSFVPINPAHRPSLDLQEAELADRRQKLEQQAAELEADRALWYRRRQEMDREWAKYRDAADKQQEVDKLRGELAEVRRDLHRQYQERRDRLAGLQQSVQTAASKVQEQKRQLDADARAAAKLRDELASRLADVEQREDEVAAARRAIEDDQQRREALYNDATAAVEARLAECDKREKYIAERDARAQGEWLRIERQRAEVERREQELAARTAETEARAARLAADETAVRQREAQVESLAGLRQRLDADREAVERRAADLDARTLELEQQASEQAAWQVELDKLRNELTAAQKDLHQRYQERRDRLAGLQQAVQVAAQKVQEAKRTLAAQEDAVAPRIRELDARATELDRRDRDLRDARAALDTSRQETEAAHAEITGRLQALAKELKEQQAGLDEKERSLAEREERHRADLARLDRFQETVEQRERAADAGAAEAERQRDQLRRDTLELEEQARQLDAAAAAQKDEAVKLEHARADLEAATARLHERASQVEGQQAMLAALRTRLERMRTEVRAEAQLLAEQRTRHEATERELAEKVRAAEDLRQSIDAEGQVTTSARQQFEARSAELQAAVAKMRELQQKLLTEEETIRKRAEDLDARAAEQAAQAAELTARANQLVAVQEKLAADRQAVKEREAALTRDEEARKALQEQLRRRAEELGVRHKQVEELGREHATRAGEVGEEHEAVARQRQAAETALAAARADLDRQMAEMRSMGERLTQSENRLRQQTDRLKSAGRALAAVKKAHAEVRRRWEADRQSADDETRRVRAELEEYRKQTQAEADALNRQLPDLELRGEAVLVRLGQAREELRGHLSGLHAYAGQSQEDLEALQARVRGEAERLREQERTVQRARAEHRLAVTAFRQQLVEWQGRVAEMRRVLADDGTRLERKQAEVAAAAEQVDETAQKLARQAADLHEQERQVGERRSEVERHLEDMREWYRHKLRELAQGSHGSARSAGGIVKFQSAPEAPAGAESNGGPKPATAPDDHDVLSLTDDLDPGDRKLGDLLRSLDLVDADTLTALLLEARRQRRSLRQVLLSARGGGTPLLTLYQLALIESGNVDGLVLGPTRVIDRLQATPREVVYRVFDPRRAAQGQGTLLLRHLSEAEMHDAVHPDEFRQRFSALAGLADPHLAGTVEVLEVNGRPAALQEWLTGLPSTEWPLLAAVPAVWHCLLIQASSGLHAAHSAGLVHGRLTARSVVLSPAGVVKLSGCGEPPWLSGGPADATPTDDLAALGEVAAGWAAVSRKKGLKPAKPLPESLQRVLARLRPDATDRYASAADLLAELERIGADIPAAADTWERLVAHAAENATDGVAWRKSA